MNTGSYETTLPHHTQVQSINPLKGQKLLQLPAVAGRCGVSSPGYLFQHSRTHAPHPEHGTGPWAAGTEWYQGRFCGNAGPLFTIFVENKPACPSGWGRRGRPRAWERSGRWLPFPGCRQLAVAMAAVCFPFLPAPERKARVAACLFLNAEKAQKGLTCAAAPAAGLGQQPPLFAALSMSSVVLGLDSPCIRFGVPLHHTSFWPCPVLSILSP